VVVVDWFGAAGAVPTPPIAPPPPPPPPPPPSPPPGTRTVQTVAITVEALPLSPASIT